LATFILLKGIPTCLRQTGKNTSLNHSAALVDQGGYVEVRIVEVEQPFVVGEIVVADVLILQDRGVYVAQAPDVLVLDGLRIHRLANVVIATLEGSHVVQAYVGEFSQ